jgi:hypothetical protein
MKLTLFLSAIFIAGAVNAQGYEVVFHQDLLKEVAANTSYKVARNELYSHKLKEIQDKRERIAAYSTSIEEVQRQIFNSLSNVDNAIKNSKALYNVALIIPKIFKNLTIATGLAAGKPYLISIAANTTQIFTGRIIQLQDYLEQFVLSADEKTLMDPIQRTRFVLEVSTDINILYNLSEQLVNNFKLYNLNDAVNRIVPYKMYINMDAQIVNDMLNQFKF